MSKVSCEKILIGELTNLNDGSKLQKKIEIEEFFKAGEEMIKRGGMVIIVQKFDKEIILNNEKCYTKIDNFKEYKEKFNSFKC